MKSTLEMVREWHDKFGVVLPTKPKFDKDNCALRISLLTEEKNELQEASFTNNPLEILDALCDCRYVLDGAILHTGMAEMVGDMSKGTIVTRYMASLKFDVAARIQLYSIKIKYLSWKFLDKNEIEIAQAFRDLDLVLKGLVYATGMDKVFAAAFCKVHENNTDKVWTTQEMAACADKEIRFHKCDWREGFIARNSIGKIIKPPTHKKVNLSEFIQ